MYRLRVGTNGRMVVLTSDVERRSDCPAGWEYRSNSETDWTIEAYFDPEDREGIEAAVGSLRDRMLEYEAACEKACEKAREIARLDSLDRS